MREFFENLPPLKGMLGAPVQTRLRAADPNKPLVRMIGGSTMIFALGMSQENIDLVTKSNLFGQLVATTKVREDHEIKY